MAPDGDGAIRFSYRMPPDYPLSDAIEMIKAADKLGCYARYSVDGTWQKETTDQLRLAAERMFPLLA